MSEPTLVDRMKDYFARQIAWLDEQVTEFDALEQDLDSPGLESVVDRQRRGAEKSLVLEQEFRALQKEWEANRDHTQESGQQEVRALARRAEELAVRLAELSVQAADRVDARLAEIRAELNAVRKGRDHIRKFSSESGQDPGFMDRKI